MFNVSKKTLSLVLCLTLIASVVVFCFTGPASAVTTVKYPTYDSVTSLAAKPTVNLIFEGDNYGGIPIGRWTNGVQYVDGYAKVTSTTGWVFFGKDGSVGKTTATHNTEAGKAALGDLFMLEVGHTYFITMQYKKLAGATVATTSLNYGITADPTAVAAQNSDAYIKDVVTSGLTVVWNVDGVAQESGSVLEKDTDWQTVSVKLTAVQSGAFGFQPNGGGYYAFDDFKIYDSTALGNSFQNPLSFDNGGVDFGRYMGNKYGYKTDDVDGNSNSYFWYDGTTDYEKDKNGVWKQNVGTSTGSVYFSNDEYGKTWNSEINDSYDYSHMFMFLPGNSYEITFKFRIANPATYNLYDSRPEDLRELKQNKDIDIGKTTITPCFAKLPAGGSSGVIDLTAKNISNYVKDLYYNGLAIENAPGSGIWQTVRICFTLNDTATIDADGLYFGLRGGGFVTEIDDYNVRELINYSVKSFDNRNVSIDFENGATVESLGVTTAGASVTIKPDANSDNNYMKVTSAGNARISMNETRVLKRDKKYYISFDAKSDDGCQHFNFVMGNKGSDSSSYRIFFNNNDSVKTALKNSGSKFYINGKEVDGYTNFKPSSEWQHFGFVLNLDSKAWEKVYSAGNPDNYFNDGKWQSLENGGGVYFLFGADGKSVCYDNIKISQFDELADAVPDEGEIKDNTQVSKRNPSGTGENYISAGLRFKNCLPNDVVAAADEVGFVVIPSTMAITAPDTWYKMDGTGSASAQTVVCKNATMNQMYERTASETYYQLVLTGLSTESGKTAYNRRFSAVMYVKNADGTYQYFALGETSYNQVGAIKDVVKKN